MSNPSEFYRFGRQLRDMLRGLLLLGEVQPVADRLPLETARAVRDPEKLLAYLSVPQRTVWVRQGEEERVKKDLRATEVGPAKWRVRTQVSGGDLEDEFTVRVVDQVTIGDDPKPGDTRDWKDYDCTKTIPASDSKCQNEKDEDGNVVASHRSTSEKHKVCESAQDKTCKETWKEAGQHKFWDKEDCKGNIFQIYYLYRWRCD